MAPTTVTWRKSSHSGNTGGDCVEVARLDAVIGLRDSKNPHVGHLTIPAEAFAALLARLKLDELKS